jgi:AcrR family transcriptional regulator
MSSAPAPADPPASGPRRVGAGKSRRAAALPPEQRREAIVAATLPLLMKHGLAVTTRQIAEAAGIAEGTIFRVFPDKEALIEAVVALDPAPVERRIAAIDRNLPLDDRLVEAVRVMQDRVTNVWRLMSIIGFMRPPDQEESRRRALADLRALVALLVDDADELRGDAATNARQLRALAFAGCHPALIAGEPMTPEEVVSLFLDGARRRDRAHPAASPVAAVPARHPDPDR